jgi:hypothetical protein
LKKTEVINEMTTDYKDTKQSLREWKERQQMVAVMSDTWTKEE